MCRRRDGHGHRGTSWGISAAGSPASPDRLRQFGHALFHLPETALRLAQASRRIAKAKRLGVAIDRFAIGLSGTRQVLTLLWLAGQRSSGADERIAAGPITVGQLHRFAIARSETEVLRPLERVSAALDVLEAIDKRPHQAEKRIGPVGSQLCGFAKGRDRIREFVLRFGGEFPRLTRFAIDPMEVTFAVAQRRAELRVSWCDAGGVRQHLTGHPPLRFPHRRHRRPVIPDHPIGQRRALPYQRTLETDDADVERAT